MQQINVSELKPHPRNNEFFDDISGAKWDTFLESVKSRGIIEPIIITPDKVIVSGHQRVRAAKELGITTVTCDVHTYDNDDQILQELLETNLRQRGNVDGSDKQIGLRIKELERLYGIQHGNNQYERTRNNFVSTKTQEDLAAQLDMDVRTLQNYKLLTEMIPELEDLVDTGIVTKTTALAIMRNLSPEEQEELISSMDTTKKITKEKVQEYINEIKRLKENPSVPADYELIKKRANDYKSDYEHLQNEFQEKVKELQDLRKQLETMNDNSPATKYEQKLKDSVLLFCSRVANFIESVGGYVWLTNEINNIPETEREGYIRSVGVIKSWADTMEYNIKNNIKEEN